jgi:uncharacterized protein HemX
MRSIDEILEAMPEPRRTKIRQRILALIHDAESRESADWTGVSKLKDERVKRRTGRRL